MIQSAIVWLSIGIGVGIFFDLIKARLPENIYERVCQHLGTVCGPVSHALVVMAWERIRNVLIWPLSGGAEILYLIYIFQHRKELLDEE